MTDISSKQQIHELTMLYLQNNTSYKNTTPEDLYKLYTETYHKISDAFASDTKEYWIY